jgi:hypothetical protein
MTSAAQSQTDRPDPTVIAAQNDVFRKFACLEIQFIGRLFEAA